MDYTVRLSSFEGPLDLLLFLIRKNELDIYDIPISLLVQQYIEYLADIEVLDIDKAGEYLLMLATLMRIKSRMLLPGEETDEEDAEEDPRAELVQKLIEYQQFKDIASALEEREEARSLLYLRGAPCAPAEGFEEEPPQLDVGLETLLEAFRTAMQKLSEQEPFVPGRVEYRVEDKMEFIMNRLEQTGSLKLEEMFASCRSKLELIVLFLALLELMRVRKLRVIQQGAFGELAVFRITEQDDNWTSQEEETT